MGRKRKSKIDVHICSFMVRQSIILNSFEIWEKKKKGFVLEGTRQGVGVRSSYASVFSMSYYRCRKRGNRLHPHLPICALRASISAWKADRSARISFPLFTSVFCAAEVSAPSSPASPTYCSEEIEDGRP